MRAARAEKTMRRDRPGWPKQSVLTRGPDFRGTCHLRSAARHAFALTEDRPRKDPRGSRAYPQDIA